MFSEFAEDTNSVLRLAAMQYLSTTIPVQPGDKKDTWSGGHFSCYSELPPHECLRKAVLENSRSVFNNIAVSRSLPKVIVFYRIFLFIRYH